MLQMLFEELPVAVAELVVEVVGHLRACVPAVHRHSSRGRSALGSGCECADEHDAAAVQALFGSGEPDLLDPRDLRHRETLHVVEHHCAAVHHR